MTRFKNINSIRKNSDFFTAPYCPKILENNLSAPAVDPKNLKFSPAHLLKAKSKNDSLIKTANNIIHHETK